MRNLSNVSSLISSLSNSNSSSVGFSLTDYAMIKSGSYGKLMKAYYNSDSKLSSVSSSSSAKDKVSSLADSVDKTGLTKLNSEADSLKSVASDLASSDIWNNSDIKKEDMTSAVKKFVDGYNSVIDQSNKVSSSSVSSNVSYMKSMTSTMSKSLANIGITVGTDNKLNLDENTLTNANTKNVKNLFSGEYSYGGQIADKAANIASASNISSTYNSNATTNSALLSMFNTSV